MQLTTSIKDLFDSQTSRLLCKYCCFLLVIASPLCLQAKSTSLIQPQLTHISDQQGLSQNSINSFYEDSDGFIWISTLAGVNRYDGTKMLVIDDPENIFTHKPFNSVNSDKLGNYWLNGRDGLVQLSENGEHIQLTQFPAEKLNWMQANMLVGSSRLDNEQLLVFSWNGVYYLNPQEKDILQPKSMSIFHSESNNLLSYLKADNGYWLGTSMGLFFYTLETQQLKKITLMNAPVDFKISNLHYLDPQNLLLASTTGVYQLSLNSKPANQLKEISSEKIGATAAKNNKTFYTVGDKLYQYRYETGESSYLFALKDTLSDFSEYMISSLFLDSNELLWIGTQSQGAYIWDTKIPTFETWRANAQDPSRRLDDDEVWSIKVNKQDNYWVATGKGLNLIESKTGATTRVLNMLDYSLDSDKADVFDVIEIDNTLWLATQYGLIEHDLNTKKTTTHIPADSSIDAPFVIYSLTSIDNKSIWLATDDGMLTFNILLNEFTYNRDIMTRFNASETRQVSYQNDLLWIGSQAKLISYDLETRRNKLIFENKRDLDGVFYFLTDILVEGNTAWLSFAGDGIYGIDFSQETAQQVARFHTSSGLPDNQIFALEKRGHILWATTSQGLLRINTRNGQHRLFDHKDGLVGNEFNEGSSALLSTGELLLGSTRGLTKITPQKLLKSAPVPAPKIAEAKLFSGQGIKHLWPIRETISVSETNDLLELQLTNFDYKRTYSSVFEYWFDSDNATERRYTTIARLTITDLPVGEHTLYLRSKTVNESNTSETTPIKIRVTKANRLESIGQYALFILVFILVVTLSRYWYKKYQKSKTLVKRVKENEKRLELALLDESRGVWDCMIAPGDYRLSSFKISQYQHQPLELSLEQYIGSIHPDDLSNARNEWEKFLSGETDEIDISYRCYFFKHWFWCNFQGRISEYQKAGLPMRATGIWKNVDHEKNMENKLNLYSDAFDSTQDIILILDKDFKILFVNQAYEYTTGFPSNSLVGKSMIEVAMARSSSQETQSILNHLESHNRWHGQSTIARKNAASFAIEVKINLIQMGREKVGYVVVMSEVLQAKDAENKSLRNHFYDRSTGLPSKTLAFDRLRQQIASCRNNSESMSLIFLGIDHFDKLKSALRPGSVDSLFSQLTSRLLPYIRKNDLLARYEPDIFLIVIQHTSDESNVQHTVNQLLRELAKPIELSSQQINISACAGISSYPDDGENWSELITKGETALAQTKKQGSNLFKYYHEDSNKKALERVALEHKLSKALEESELYLVFQPIIELKTNRIIELDINLRWRADDDRIIYPSQFLPLVSELGMHREFSDWLISSAFATLQRWNEEGLSVCININLSAEYLATNHAIDFIKTKLSSHRINPKFVFIAILEGDPSFSIKKLEPYLKEIYGLGINMVLDDFGKLRASLNDVTSIKFHSVKLSKRLTRNIGKSTVDDKILVSLISMMDNINVATIAKGIESAEQLEYLTNQGCKYGQGFLISDPLNESQARQSLLAR